MSRLFSRLENMGQDQAEGARPDVARPADMPAGAASPASTIAAGPAPADGGSTSPGSTPGDTRAVSLPVPGYSILSSLSRPALPETSIAFPAPPEASPGRALWPTRAWLASLLLLVGLSLLVLAMPEREQPSTVRQAPAAAPVPDATAAGTVPVIPAAADTAMPADRPALKAAGAVVNAVPAARPPRTPVAVAVPPRPAAKVTPAAPPAASAACSEAMLAMNLCNKTSP